ncbi:MAG: hypothetical protein ABI665_22280 [Vicinamibacterales bacterium]
MIFGVAIVALGAEHLVCANMAAEPFPAQFHAVVVPQHWGLRGEVCEVLALSSAAFVLAARSPFADVGRVLFGITAVVFGVDHFLALDLIASLVPAWMPGHLLLASFTGAAMIAAGLSILMKRLDGIAAFGLGTVFLLIVLTLHLPRVLAAPQSPDEWSSALIALGMCGASWICAPGREP